MLTIFPWLLAAVSKHQLIIDQCSDGIIKKDKLTLLFSRLWKNKNGIVEIALKCIFEAHFFQTLQSTNDSGVHYDVDALGDLELHWTVR